VQAENDLREVRDLLADRRPPDRLNLGHRVNGPSTYIFEYGHKKLVSLQQSERLAQRRKRQSDQVIVDHQENGDIALKR
jgi:hypothetical protein